LNFRSFCACTSFEKYWEHNQMLSLQIALRHEPRKK
jgi:hypothetical protein